MSGTTLDPSPEERAFHEAGHVVVAYVLRKSFPLLKWATILPQGSSAGCCGFGDFEDEAENFIAMCWGGFSAQYRYLDLAAGERRKAAGLPTDEAWELSFRAEYVERLTASAADDFERMKTALKDLDSDTSGRIQSEGQESANMIIEGCWTLVKHIARELMEYKTLYHDEAFRSLEAFESDSEQGLRELREYRASRKTEPELQGWNARGPWFESFASWSARR